ncbi:MAG: 3-hydroxyanthranilate 3,4-dioxygenase [Planctomycetota bacterium]|jgi:3-hydroxyanthranilate 3,4-dioxygenase
MFKFSPANLKQWVEDHRDELKPPVGNKQIWKDDRDTIIMIVGGPNKRNDYHLNVTEEFFYQIEGDIVVGIINDEGKPEDIVIREGEIFLLPANVPHSPRRPANTVGMVVELKRPGEAVDGLRWYCPECHQIIYEEAFKLENIAVDLKKIMEKFWSSNDLRTCDNCGTVMPEPQEAQPPAPVGA